MRAAGITSRGRPALCQRTVMRLRTFFTVSLKSRNTPAFSSIGSCVSQVVPSAATVTGASSSRSSTTPPASVSTVKV
jgi:hypothetical protein